MGESPSTAEPASPTMKPPSSDASAPPQPPHERRDQGGGGGGQQDQIGVATEPQPKKPAASSEQKKPPPQPVLNAQLTAAESSMKPNPKQSVSAIPRSDGSHGPEPEPVEYLIDNKETFVFTFPDFAERPDKRGKRITTTTTVHAGGHPFTLSIYPRGIHLDTDTEYVAMYLRYEGKNTETDPVNARFQIRTKTKKRFLFTSKFSSKTSSWGSDKFKKREDMIRDDLDFLGSLTVDVDITIGKLGRPSGGAGTPTVALSFQRNEGGGSASVVVPNAVLSSGKNTVGVGNKIARKQNKNQSKKLAASSEQKSPPGQVEGATRIHLYALHEAVRCGDLPVVKCLVEEHKVNITTLTKMGQSPLQLAQHWLGQLHPVTVYLQEQLRDLSPSGNIVVGVGNKNADNGTAGPPPTISSSSTTTASTSTIGAKRSTKASATWAEIPSLPTKEQVLSKLAPCQLNAINFVQEKAKKRHEDALLKLKNRLPHLGDGSYTEEDLKKALGFIRDEAPIIIHLTEAMLRILVNNTHYRNRFETQAPGSTGGYAVRRQQWERDMFSSCYDDVPASMRVKYGCLNYCGDIRGVKSVRKHYGLAYIVLKSHVRHRATFSLESKSTRSEIIATNKYYAHVLHEYDDTELKKVLDVCKFARHGGRPSDCTKYKEVHIHGPICLATDIQALSIPGRQKDAGAFLSTVEAFQKQTNCNVLWQKDLLDPDDTKSKSVTSGQGGVGGGGQDQSTNVPPDQQPPPPNGSAPTNTVNTKSTIKSQSTSDKSTKDSKSKPDQQDLLLAASMLNLITLLVYIAVNESNKITTSMFVAFWTMALLGDRAIVGKITFRIFVAFWAIVVVYAFLYDY